MSLWIVILIFGLVCAVIGFAIFFNNPAEFKNKKSTFLIGIFLPIIFSYSYGETLIEGSPTNLTLIDLGGLLILGIISGIFIAYYFLVQKI